MISAQKVMVRIRGFNESTCFLSLSKRGCQSVLNHSVAPIILLGGAGLGVQSEQAAGRAGSCGARTTALHGDVLGGGVSSPEAGALPGYGRSGLLFRPR